MIFTSLFSQSAKVPQLSMLYPPEFLREYLLPVDSFHPYPTADERDFWDSLPELIRNSQITKGENALVQEWPFLSATLYLEYTRSGDRSKYGSKYFKRRKTLIDLVIAECIEGKGRFTDRIVDGLWSIMEESSWAIPAHLGEQKAGLGLPDTEEPQVALFSAETVNILAWTHYLLGSQLDEVSLLIRPRIVREVKARVLDPALVRDDWWWMGFDPDGGIGNWNPWCNSSLLTGCLLLEKNEEKRIARVHKILRSLDVYIGSYHPDGGCDEGPNYWNVSAGSLFPCLELLKSASNGKMDIYHEPLIKNMGRYIYRVHINEDFFVNFGDAFAREDNLYDDMIYRYGKRVGDRQMMNFGAFAAKKRLKDYPAISRRNLGRKLAAIANSRELISASQQAEPPLVRDVWLDGIQLMAARSKGGSAKGLYVAAKGGHNAAGHNHNDVGNFIVYCDGRPALIDLGVATYTRKTFGSKRYEVWNTQSIYHNLPTINGIMQKNGREFAAKDVKYKSGSSFAELSMDIAGAYPEQAGVKKWNRRIRLNRGKDLRLVDAYELEKLDGELFLSLMTPCAVTLHKGGKIILREKAGGDSSFTLKIIYEADKLTAELEYITLDDIRFTSMWGESLTRIILRAAENARLKDSWTLYVLFNEE
jgi:hypothetical protein